MNKKDIFKKLQLEKEIEKQKLKQAQSKLCYYYRKFDIAEGHCNKLSVLKRKGHFVCRKCAALEKEHEFSNSFYFIIPISCVVVAGLFFLSPWPLTSILFLAYTGCFLLWNIGKDFSFKHEGEIHRWSNTFKCLHCKAKFFDKDEKIFINHLAKEHPTEFAQVEKKSQAKSTSIQELLNENKKFKSYFI